MYLCVDLNLYLFQNLFKKKNKISYKKKKRKFRKIFIFFFGLMSSHLLVWIFKFCGCFCLQVFVSVNKKNL